MSLALEGSEDARFAPKLHEPVALQKVRICLLPKTSALVSTFKCQAFHLLTVKVGVAEHCLREGLDHVDAFHLKVEEHNKREEDADGCRLGSCREGLIEMDYRSLT
eukprot:4825020-Pleurochrysis_carterae.AAC.1